jgi:hypothetical protein
MMQHTVPVTCTSEAIRRTFTPIRQTFPATHITFTVHQTDEPLRREVHYSDKHSQQAGTLATWRTSVLQRLLTATDARRTLPARRRTFAET